MVGKRLVNTGVAAPAPFDPLQNFETVTYTGNGGTQKITGYIRKGAAFNGSSSVISTDLNFANNAKSISLWFKISDTNVYGSVVSSNNNGTGDPLLASLNWHCLQFNSTGNVLTFSILTGNWERVSTTTNNFNVNTWYNVTVTNDASSIKIYINGNLENTTTLTGTILSQDIIEIGGNTNTGGTTPVYFNGLIDQVRIFSKALDQDDVDDLYLETYADPKKSTTDYFDDGSGVALYELDEDANDTGRYGRGSIDTGYSFLFNGSSYINPASDPIPSTGAFTVSAWVKTSVSNHCFISFGDFWLKSEYISGVFSLGDLNTNFQGTTDISDGNWHHCALTVDASNNIVLYVDGVIEDTGTKTISRTNGGSFAIGVARVSNLVYYWSGNVDQVKIYSSALSASDIRELISETNAPTANLVAHYKLDGNVVDETTNHDGTWYGVNAYGSPAEFTTYDGTPTNINFLGMAFQPDLVWIKSRSYANNHFLYDSVRGATKAIYIQAEPEITRSGVTSFDANGFTLGSSADMNQSSSTYVAWSWKAGGAAVSNTDGSITSQVSANQDAGFSIGTYTGNGTAGATVGHGLSSTPELIIVKLRSGLPPKAWTVYAEPLGNTKYLYLNSLNDAGTYNFWNDTSPTDSVFSVSSDTNVNSSSGNYVFYAFHSVDGYQRVGSYTGDSSTNRIIYTTDDGTSTGNGGFQPRWVMIKAYESSFTGTNWRIYDIARGDDLYLRANGSDSETGQSSFEFDSSVTNGFRITDNRGDLNQSGDKFLFLAIA